jgi:hypothetical protein
MEKDIEYELRKIFDECEIDKETYCFSNINMNKDLKELFSKSSKNKTNNQGYPDYIYYDNITLIIFECKYENIQKASNESKFI